MKQEVMNKEMNSNIYYRLTTAGLFSLCYFGSLLNKVLIQMFEIISLSSKQH